MIEYSIEGLLEKAKKKKIIKKIPTAPRGKVDLIKEIFKNEPIVIETIKEYEMFKLIDILNKTREGEFRKGVCLRVTYKGEETAVDLDKLKEYAEILENFINYTKLFLASK